MPLVIALGGDVGAYLSARGREVYGYDPDDERVADWAEDTRSTFSGSDLAAIWPEVAPVTSRWVWRAGSRRRSCPCRKRPICR